MEFEHFALNVTNAIEIADWYVAHLDMQIVFQKKESPYMTFLADKTGRVIVEFYTNDEALIPEYASKHQLEFHFAFKTDNTEKEKQRLLKAGCTFIEEFRPEEGTHIAMLRDPWGLALQVCQRAKSLV